MDARQTSVDAGPGDAPDFTLLYDGECPLCSREIALLRRRDRRGRLGFVDIAAPGFDATRYGATREALMARIHGVLPDGSLVRDVEVFRRAYTAVGLGWLVAPTRWPLLRPLCERAYRVFARNRLRWTGRGEAACVGASCAVGPGDGGPAQPPKEVRMSLVMTRKEREAFLAQAHVGIISIAEDGRAPLAVPIWYGYEPGGELWVVTERGSRKGRLLEKARRFSLCAQTETPPYKYVSVEGPITEVAPSQLERDERPLAHRYLGRELGERYLEATGGAAARAQNVVVRMRPERWLSTDYGKQYGAGS